MPFSNIYSGKIIIFLLLSIICFELASQVTESSNLPLIVIDTRGQVIWDDPKIVAGLKVIDNGPGNTNNQFQDGTDYEGNIGIETRGQSSTMFPKKSYLIELRTETGADTSASLLGNACRRRLGSLCSLF